MSPGKLVNRDQGISVNCKHGNTFLNEIYKTFSKSLIYEIGGRRWQFKNRTSNILSLAEVNTKVWFGF